MIKTILGIETSCDDTSIAIVRGEAGQWHNPPLVLAHEVFGQGDLLSKWGGVVPELAARNHVQKLGPLLQLATDRSQVMAGDWDAIAITMTPGLLGPLLTGIHAAKTLALIYQKPLIAINHLYAHLEAVHLTTSVTYPYLGLLVSGGHSLFALVNAPDSFEILGSTIDDAAGEAFDKGGKIIGLGYPAGRLIDDLAQKGNPLAFTFPIGLKNSKNCNLSYSGVKTSLKLQFEKLSPAGISDNILADLCASYQKAIVDALLLKTQWALKSLHARDLSHLPIVLGGGVACNSELRKRLTSKFKSVHLVAPVYCTDNAAMIAAYGLRTFNAAQPFPQCLHLDANNRAIDKQAFGHE